MPRPALRRILLVEDDPDVRAVVALTLEELGGFTLAACGSAEEALAVAPRFRPDLLLLDVVLERLDGRAALAALRALPETARTPAVFLTGRLRPLELREHERLGCLGVIAKPFDPGALPDRLQELWRRR